MRRKRLLLTFLLTFCIFAPASSFCVTASEDSTQNMEPVSHSQVVSIKNAYIYQQLSNGGSEFTYYTDCDATAIFSHMHEYTDSIISTVEATINDGISDETHTEELPVSWTLPETIDTSIPGVYTITGTIVLPDGCTFADGVLTEIEIPFTILPSDVTYTIDRIHVNQYLYDQMIAVDDTEAWKLYLDDLSALAFSYNIIGISDDGGEALLDVVADTSAVDIHTPGEYEIPIHLNVSDKNTLQFSLPENLNTMRQKVKVSRPEDFELWISNYDNDSFVIDFLKTLDGSYRLYVTDSDHELSSEELAAATWTEDTYGSLNTSVSVLTVIRRNLIRGHYYYYQIRSENEVSGIGMLQDNGQTFQFSGIKGNRDGSSDSPDSDDVIQPAPMPPFTIVTPEPSTPDVSSPEPETPGSEAEKPEIPATNTKPDTPGNTITDTSDTEAPVSSSPETSEQTPPMESFTEDSDTIFGTRLDLTRKNNGGSASFSKHNIQVTLSSDTLDTLSVQDSDSLTVTIQQETPSSVTLSVSKNDVEVTDIPDTQVTLPMDGRLYSFTVQQTGTYDLPETEKDTASQHTVDLPPSDPSGGIVSGGNLPAYASLFALSLGGIFLIIRRRNFR